MKACFFTYEYPPHIYGGVGIHIKYLTKHLCNYMDIEVRTIKKDKKIPALEKIELNNHTLTIKRYLPNPAITPDIKAYTPVISAISLNISQVAEKIEADIIHSHTWYENFAGFLSKTLYDIPLVSTVHSLEPLRPWKEEQLGKSYRVSSWMEKTGLTASNRIIAVSRQMKQDIQEVYQIDGDKIEVIHNGIDTDKYRKKEDPELIEKYNIKKPFVLFIGRLTRQKGIFTLLKAARYINANVVFITGKPDTVDIEMEFSSEVKKLDNSIWINKMLTEDEIISFYSEADVFVCPSIYEPFGIINLEAMSCSTPVVASNVGGIKEIVVDNQTGFLVPPAKPYMLSEKINHLLENYELRKKFGKQGRALVEKKFSWKNIAKITYNFYKNIV